MIRRPRVFRAVTLLPYQGHHRWYSSSNSSVDANEISHFNKLASSWWDPHGSSSLLHQMNPSRHQFISECLRSQPDPQTATTRRYLDVGCGGGIFAESAARLQQTKQVIGIDPSSEVITVAKEHARQDPLLMEPGRLDYHVKSIENMALPRNPDDQFDVVSLFEVIEHINHPAPFLTSCLPHVKPGGWLILSTIARTWTSWVTTKLVAENLLSVVPPDTHDWGKYVNEHELRQYFTAQEGWGMEGGLRCQGCLYVPGFGWQMMAGGERWGNYFFGVQKNSDVL